MSKQLPKAYNPKQVEEKIYQLWEKSGFFNPDNLPIPKTLYPKPFSIAMPLPNVTGELHLGHAVTMTVEDLFTRFRRMQGYKALWIPGTDHAGIATQVMVERELQKQGKTKWDLGREKFLKKTWGFKEKSEKKILRQIKKMGASCDWSRYHFTLDKDLSEAVNQAFIKLYKDGLIYQGERIINWCPRCQTVLSDLEVEYKEEKGKLWYIRYPITQNKFIVVATTRPETMLGDTAVAVNPKDKRYKKLIGKKVILPIVERGIPIIADYRVDPEFGTGAVKITPAHDPADWEIGQEHKLAAPQVIGKDGKMTKEAEEYAGLSIFKAREEIVKRLKKEGLLEKIEDYTHSVGHCYRCGKTIEPLISEQWFIKIKPLAKKAIEAVKKGKIKIIPKRFEKVYFNWMENIKDWCISRQIWWSHPLPVWYKKTKKPTDITYFVHGTTTDNEKGKASGHYDVGLSKLGIQQSKELKSLIKDRKFDLIICSDLKRAKQTAKYAFKNVKIIYDKRLREIDYGKLTRTDSKRIEKNMAKYITETFPKGESYRDIELRVKDLLAKLIDKYPGKKIAFIAHQAPQLALDVLLKEKTWEEAIKKDWRLKKAWQPGWDYKLEKLIEVQVKSPGKEWKQDENTLDTWFSSSLWTFSTLGWPKKTKDLKFFHPTSVMETGWDILFFWVARMIMMSLYLLDEVPFKTVYLHGLVLDPKTGEKMSKTKGTGLDPLTLIEKYGTDALRMSLVLGTTAGQDFKLYEEKIAGYRNFGNKLWNIARYILGTIEAHVDKSSALLKKESISLADRWILSRLNRLVASVTNDLENFRLGKAGEDLYEFVWHEFADWYLEISKLQKKSFAFYVLSSVLRLLHPFMPFITEEIWQKICQVGAAQTCPTLGVEPLMIQPWPEPVKKFINTKVEKEFKTIQDIIVGIRNARAKYKLEPAKIVKAYAITKTKKKLLEEQKEIIERLTRVELEIRSKKIKVKKAITLHINRIDIVLSLS